MRREGISLVKNIVIYETDQITQLFTINWFEKDNRRKRLFNQRNT